MNHIPFKDYNRANEILYVVNAIDKVDSNSISKVSIQKMIYLANVLSPIKNIVLATIEFLSQKRGPYSFEIQNTVDQLVANGFIKIVEFNSFKNNASIAHYAITNSGKEVVKNLLSYHKESEKEWWYSLIVGFSKIYSGQEVLANESISGYNGLDKIVNLVYQDLTYLDIKENYNFKEYINVKDKSNPTYELIEFTKEFITENDLITNIQNERKIAEIIMLGYFEYLYSKYLDNELKS